MFGAWRAARRQPQGAPGPFLTRLTSDVGWTDYPAISLDGKMLAYASDRSGDGNLDIWVQQIPDGPPVRLTRHAADDIEPSFSADGSRIAFQSSRLGGGVYVVPTLGGEERLLAARGFLPALLAGRQLDRLRRCGTGGGRIYVAPAASGPATPVAPRLLPELSPTCGHPTAEAPAVLGDSAAATRHPRTTSTGTSWRSRAGRPCPRERAASCCERDSRRFKGCRSPMPGRARADRVLFHGNVGDSSNMWQVALSPEELARQRDAAAGDVRHHRRGGGLGDLGRADGVRQPDVQSDIWSLPIDADRGTVEGSLKRVTQDAADDYDPTLSDDGATLVFRSRRAGRFAVVLRRLGSTGRDRPDQNAGGALSGGQPRWNPGRVLVPAGRQDAHLRRGNERRNARAGVRRLWRSEGVVTRGRPDPVRRRHRIRQALAS